MSNFLSKALHGIGHAAQGVGHVVGSIASNPLVDAGIGAFFGPGAAAAAGGLGHLLAPGGNIGEGLKGAAVGYGAGKAGQLIKGALPTSIGGGGGGLPSVASGVGGIARTALGVGADGASGGGVFGTGLSPAVLGLAGLGMANSAQLGNKANDFADKAWNLTNQSYKDRADLRSTGIDQLLHPQAPQTGDLTSLRMQNGVARRALTPPVA